MIRPEDGITVGVIPTKPAVTVHDETDAACGRLNRRAGDRLGLDDLGDDLPRNLRVDNRRTGDQLPDVEVRDNLRADLPLRPGAPGVARGGLLPLTDDRAGGVDAKPRRALGRRARRGRRAEEEERLTRRLLLRLVRRTLGSL